ncbi:hypothetical protein LV478_11790 [Komagataeibacter oboediens]|uniref:hypothetical protein n=1 Tax=Komagataeibacter oboediens TaxID=65958 RepID=UPI0023DCD28D|nr:hypothetical protein [Komagataeibacter oboediens]WEQ51212.1 hypothetical protein LV478_11790 [Komagataeibacter oboediens]
MSPALNFRSDMEKWQSGASELTNFFVHVQGGISNRAGTEYVAIARQTGAIQPRLIPFIYNNTQSYVLEFGDLYIRIISNGAYLTNSDGSVYEVVTPYAIADVYGLKYTQSADVMTITHQSYVAYDLSRLGQTDWALTAISYGTSLTAPGGIVTTYTPGNAGNTGTKPGISKADYSYVVTSVSDTLNTESYASAVSTVNNYNIGYYEQYGNYNPVSWDAAANAEYYNVYRLYAGLYGLIGSTTGTSLDDLNYAPDTTTGPPTHKDPFSGNNPVAVGYFQQRRVFAGASDYPQTVWMSRSANYANFDVHTPVRDDDAITATIASQQVNTIKHIVAMPDLLVFTGSGIWKVSAGGQTGEAITPSNFTAIPQIYVGSSDVRPIPINTDVLFIEGKGSHVRDLQYDWYAAIYTGNDLSVMAEHLFYGYTIADWGFAQFPFNLLWAVRSDGTLLGMTYLKEQNIWAWHQHATVNGSFKSVCVVPEVNDYGAIEDVAYFLVERTINNVTSYYIERMVTRQLGADNNDLTKAWFVDCGLRYTGAPVSTVSGLEHLEGQTVSACIDGKGYTGLTVANGSVALPVSGSTITVGLPIAAHAQTLPLDVSQPPQFARRKRISKVYASLYNSCGLMVSTNGGANTYPIGNTGTAGAMTTGLALKIPSPIWTQVGQMDFYVNTPTPVTLTSLSFDVEEGN